MDSAAVIEVVGERLMVVRLVVTVLHNRSQLLGGDGLNFDSVASAFSRSRTGIRLHEQV